MHFPFEVMVSRELGLSGAKVGSYVRSRGWLSGRKVCRTHSSQDSRFDSVIFKVTRQLWCYSSVWKPVFQLKLHDPWNWSQYWLLQNDSHPFLPNRLTHILVILVIQHEVIFDIFLLLCRYSMLPILPHKSNSNFCSSRDLMVIISGQANLTLFSILQKPKWSVGFRFSSSCISFYI